MKKIEINLCPYSVTEDKKIQKLIAQYFPFVFLAALGFIVINIFLFSVASVSFLTYSQLGKKWSKESPKAMEIELLKKEVTALKEKKKSYDELIKANVAPSYILSDIYKALPINIWLSDIRATEASVSLTGYVVKWQEDYLVSLGNLIKNLKKESHFSGYFKDIIQKSSRKTNLFNVEVMKFELECKK